MRPDILNRSSPGLLSNRTNAENSTLSLVRILHCHGRFPQNQLPHPTSITLSWTSCLFRSGSQTGLETRGSSSGFFAYRYIL
jgi:hypothetical protein